MGKYDETMYDYLSDEARFADLFNAGCFHGRQIVDADRLEQLDGRLQIQMMTVRKNGGRRRRKRIGKSIYRDIRMKLPDGTRFIILAVENQTLVDYEMPWRIMRYDCAEYENQIKALHRKKREKMQQGENGGISPEGQRAGLTENLDSEDRLSPVYTVCFYHGTEPWTGPRSLKDMMDFNAGSDTSELWERLFVDYRMIFVDASDPEIAGKCQTDLKLLLDVLRLRGDRESMRELLQSAAYDDLDRDTAEAIAVMTNMPGIAEHIEEYKNNDGGGYSMCVAIEGIKEDARQEGISQNLIKNIESAMKNFKIDLQTACKGLDTTVEEYEQAKKLLRQAKE